MVASWPPAAIVGPAQQAVKWLADENFRNAIIRGLLRQSPALDVVAHRMFQKYLAKMI